MEFRKFKITYPLHISSPILEYNYERDIVFKIVGDEDYFLTLPYWSSTFGKNKLCINVILCKITKKQPFGVEAIEVADIKYNKPYGGDLETINTKIPTKFENYLKTLSLEDMIVEAKLEKL